MKTTFKVLIAALLAAGLSTAVNADNDASADLCLDAGPQTPRDISNGYGLNNVPFPKAPPSTASASTCVPATMSSRKLNPMASASW